MSDTLYTFTCFATCETSESTNRKALERLRKRKIHLYGFDACTVVYPIPADCSIIVDRKEK